MKNTLRKTLTFILTFLLLFSSFLTLSNYLNTDAKTITEADIKAIKDKIAANKRKINEYSVSSNAFDGDLSKAIEEKEKLDQQIFYIQEVIQETDALIFDYDQLINEKEETIQIKDADIEAKYEAFGKFLRASYESGQKSYIELLVSSSSLIDFLTRADNLGSMLKYQQKIVDELNKEITGLENLKSDLETKKAEFESLLNSQKESEIELENQITLQQNLIKKLEKDQSAQQALLAKAQKDQAKLEKELQNTIAAYNRQVQEAQNKKLLWPLDPKYNKVSSKYGNRVLFGKQDFHYGIDIPAPLGTDVLAANDGKVIKATYSSSYGYYILVDHGGDKSTLYAHLSKMLVSVGQIVKRGQIIAKVGATGNAYGYHLHFEVRKSGNHTNPLVKNMMVINYNGKMVDVTEKGVIIISG